MKSKSRSITNKLILLLAFVLLLAAGVVPPAQAQTFSVLYNFSGASSGANPLNGLMIDASGNLYGTASAGKHSFLKQRGVHEAIDYTKLDWTREVARLTQGRGVELITDPLGGSEWKKSYRALRHTGRLGMFGASTATESRLPGPLKLLKVGFGMPWFNPLALMNENRSVFGVNLGHLWHEAPKIADWMSALAAGVTAGWVRPHVDRTFRLAEAGEAHAYIEARKNTGKVVLVM